MPSIMNSYNVYRDIRNSLLSNKLREIRNEYKAEYLDKNQDKKTQPTYLFRGDNTTLYQYCNYTDDALNNKFKYDKDTSQEIYPTCFNTNLPYIYQRKRDSFIKNNPINIPNIEKECRILEDFLDLNGIRYKSNCSFANGNNELYIKQI